METSYRVSVTASLTFLIGREFPFTFTTSFTSLHLYGCYHDYILR